MRTDQVRFGFHPRARFQEDAGDTAPLRAIDPPAASSSVDDWAASLHDLLTALDGLFPRLDEGCHRGMGGSSTVRTIHVTRINTQSSEANDQRTASTLRRR